MKRIMKKYIKPEIVCVRLNDDIMQIVIGSCHDTEAKSMDGVFVDDEEDGKGDHGEYFDPKKWNKFEGRLSSDSLKCF
jgi:hypothetical protein